MSKRIIFFIAGRVATDNEKSQIAAIANVVEPQFELTVYNGAASPNYGAGIASADYVAGTIPTAYSNAGTYPVFAADAPPFTVGDTQIVVTDGDVIEVGAQSFTFTVVEGVVTAIDVV